MTWIQHVNVVVPIGGTQAALAFYREVLGMQPIPKPTILNQAGGWLQVAGMQQLHISERAGAPHPDAHFALVADDFDSMLERLAAAGASWQDQEDIFGGRRGYTRDPAGNRVEILEAAGQLFDS
jgi:catechol 2,3-dioxygenase-like lactoylglutathione lyase family enzyme